MLVLILVSLVQSMQGGSRNRGESGAVTPHCRTHRRRRIECDGIWPPAAFSALSGITEAQKDLTEIPCQSTPRTKAHLKNQ